MGFVLGLIFLIMPWNTVLKAELCTKTVTVGDKDFKKHGDNLDDLSGVMYLVSSDMYRFPCCGIVHAAKTHIVKMGDVRFLVWRPTADPNKYRVAGDFTIEVTSVPKTGGVIPSGILLLQVQEGDLIGWYVPGESSVPYVEGDIDGHVYLVNNTEGPTLGEVVDFSTASKVSGRIYAIAAGMDEDTNIPEFKGTAPEVKISSGAEIGSTVVKVSLFDPQVQDAIVTVSENSYFEIPSGGRNVILKSQPEPGVYELILTSTSPCGVSATATTTVNVVKEAVNLEPGLTVKTTNNLPKTNGPFPQTEIQEQPSGQRSTDRSGIRESTGANKDITSLSDSYLENTTVDVFIMFPTESETSLWKVFTGLSVTLVLFASCVLIGRYAWILYGGRFTAKTDTELFTNPDVEKAELKESEAIPATDTESLSRQQANDGTSEAGDEMKPKRDPEQEMEQNKLNIDKDT